MIIRREDIESREKATLAPYAVKSSDSKGREYVEPEDPYRTCFQRDRDRIIHSKAFRRLKGKTQVFIAHYGDHYRSRLTHTMEVAQISRDIARMLGLNEDLAETIALAHDLGHTPFGHAGQDAMHAAIQKYGGRFEHNEQSRRLVELLEEKSSKYKGLNLTFEVRDGLMKHRTTYDTPEVVDCFMPSLEAQIVNIADEIAYQSHDIDDGIRSGILIVDDLKHLDIWMKAETSLDDGLPFDIYIHSVISSIMAFMIDDLVMNTEAQLNKFNISSVIDVCQQKDLVASFSPAMSDMSKQLKDFLYKNFYQSEGVTSYNKKGEEVILFLFETFYNKSDLLPEKHQSLLNTEELHLVVKDYISGMTDNFALSLYGKMKNDKKLKI